MEFSFSFLEIAPGVCAADLMKWKRINEMQAVVGSSCTNLTLPEGKLNELTQLEKLIER